MNDKDLDKMFQEETESLEKLPQNVKWSSQKGWKSYENRYLKKRRFPRFLKYAATIILLLASAFFVFQFINNDPEYIQVSTHNCDKTSVTLSDGSSIFLNKNSTLRYPVDLNRRNKNLFLEGEAYFEFKESKCERTIITESAVTRVSKLKSRLNIKTVDVASSDDISVMFGSAAVSNPNIRVEEILCVAGERVSVYKTNNFILKEENQDKNTLAWKSGKLEFENMPIQYAIQKISEVYCVPIVFNRNEIKSGRISMSIANPNLDVVLDIIKKETKTEVQFIDGKYQFVPITFNL